MKAVKIGATAGLGHLEMVELPEPQAPGPGEIRVRIHATSLNYHDYSVAKNGGPARVGRILMSDGAGVVEQVGHGVTEFSVGDRVVSTFFPTWLDGEPTEGSFATVPGDGVDGYACEVVVRPTTWFTHAPKGFNFAESATLTTAGLTAWRALVGDGHLKAGDSVLVLGTGGVSMFALQFAKATGASVVVTSSSDDKLARARQLGADHTINYKSVTEWGDAVLGWTGGRGVDHVIELGGPGTVAQSIRAARVGGHISLIGTLTGYTGQVPTAAMMIKQIRLQGLIVGSRKQQQQMIRALAATSVRPVIDRTFALEELADAFRFQESGNHFGKICVEY